MAGPKSPKRRSSFAAFTASTEGLILIEGVMRRALTNLRKAASSGDADAFSSFRDVSDGYLRVVDRVREQLRADLQARTMYEDLRERLESGMSNDEVQQTLEAHFRRMGWGSIAEAKAELREYLIREQGLDPESADLIVRDGLPRGDGRSRQLPIVHKMRKAYRGMEDTLTEDAEALREALHHSEEASAPSDGSQATDTSGNPSEEA